MLAQNLRHRQRPGAVADALADVARDLAKFPGESVTIKGPYRDREGWWRVTVKVGERSAFAPRFAPFDDANEFRSCAAEMASDVGCA